MEYFLFFLPVVFAIIVINMRRKPVTKGFIELSNGFTGAFLMGVLVLHLLPEVFQGPDDAKNIPYFIFAGLLVQVILEITGRGLDHGHGHKGHGATKNIAIVLLISLFVHSFLETIPIKSVAENGYICPMHHHEHGGGFSSYYTGVLLHNIPISFVLYMYLLQAGFAKNAAIPLMLLYACANPLGMLLGERLPLVSRYYFETLAFVIGILLHVSAVMLFESGGRAKKLIVIILGLALAILFTNLHF